MCLEPCPGRTPVFILFLLIYFVPKALVPIGHTRGSSMGSSGAPQQGSELKIQTLAFEIVRREGREPSALSGCQGAL